MTICQRRVLVLIAAIGLFACDSPDDSPGHSPRPVAAPTSILTGLDAAGQLIMLGRWQAATDTLRLAGVAGADPVAVSLHMAQVQLATGHAGPARNRLHMLPPAAAELPLYQVLEAWLLAADGNSLRAQSSGRSILKRFPESIEARVLLARLALQAAATMNLDEARDLCREVLERVPEHRVAAHMLVQATLRNGHYDEAVALGLEQAARHPDDGHLQMLVGTAAFWRQDHDTASRALQRSGDLFTDAYTDRLKALWLLHLSYEQSGADPDELPPEYHFHVRTPPAAMPSAPSFVDVAADAGVAKIDRGRGGSWLDYDGDGDWDLFSVGIHSNHALYRNDSEHFSEQTAAMGLADPRGGWGASAADPDDDGDPDLFVTRDAWEGVAPNSLYRNDGEAGFTDVAASAAVAGAQASFTATWGDYDVDGRLDLYVANGVIADGGANSLHRNISTPGTLLFADVAADAGVGDTLKTVGTATGDYDGDGWPDIYSVNIGGPNRLFRNLMGTSGRLEFVDTAPTSGVVFPVEGGYVTFFLDYDNDGRLDLFVSTMSGFEDFLHSAVAGQAVEPNRPFLYRNEGDGTFTDVAVLAGLGRSFGTMGAGVGDVNNDGLPDIYLANGGPEMSRLEPNILFQQRGDGTFADVSDIAGVGNLGKGHGVTFADYDADGDLDLYAGLGGHYNADVWPNALYRNDGPGDEPVGHSVSVRALSGARDAIGATITVRAGRRTVHGQIATGFGFGSSNSPGFFAGTGAARAETLEVRWPDGTRQTWSNLPPATHITVRAGSDQIDIDVPR